MESSATAAMASAWPGQRSQVGGARLSSNSSHAAPSALAEASLKARRSCSFPPTVPVPAAFNSTSRTHEACSALPRWSTARVPGSASSEESQAPPVISGSMSVRARGSISTPGLRLPTPIQSPARLRLACTGQPAASRHNGTAAGSMPKACTTSWKMPKQGPHGHSYYACATRTNFRRHREKINASGACDLQSGTSVNTSTNGCERRACDGKARTTARRVSRSSMGFIRCCANATTVQHQRTKLLRRDIAGRQ